MIVNKPRESYSSRQVCDIADGAVFYYNDELYIMSDEIAESGRYMCVSLEDGTLFKIDGNEIIQDNQIFKITEITLELRK